MKASTFNAVLKQNQRKNNNQSNSPPFMLCKAVDDKRLVFGWASVSININGEQLEDRQEDVIAPEMLEEAAYEYVLNFRDAGEEHIPTLRKKARLVESCVFTKEKQKALSIPENTIPEGWWIGFYVDDDSAWEKIKNGTYKMFSIEGTATRVPIEQNNDGATEEGKEDPNSGQ